MIEDLPPEAMARLSDLNQSLQATKRDLLGNPLGRGSSAIHAVFDVLAPAIIVATARAERAEARLDDMEESLETFLEAVEARA